MTAELTTLTEYGAELVKGLQERIKSFPATRFGPVNATGNLAKSIRSEVTATATGYRLTLYAASYALTLEYGRKPGKFPNLLSIVEWRIVKNIVPRPDAAGHTPSTVIGPKGYSPFDFVLARGIARKGTTIYQSGAPSNLFGALLNPDQLMAAIITRFTPLLVAYVRSAIHAIVAEPLPA